VWIISERLRASNSRKGSGCQVNSPFVAGKTLKSRRRQKHRPPYTGGCPASTLGSGIPAGRITKSNDARVDRKKSLLINDRITCLSVGRHFHSTLSTMRTGARNTISHSDSDDAAPDQYR
jgi:hypothetical protein